MNAFLFHAAAVAALATVVTTYLLVPLVARVTRALGILDMPGGRRTHKRPIPRTGGVAVFVGFHIGCAVYFVAIHTVVQTSLCLDWWLKHLLLSGLLLAVGLVDDARGMRPLLKLAAQTGVALLAYLMGIRMGAVMGVALPAALDMVATVLWCLTFINAFNLIDGMDGLASGLATIAAVGIAGGLICLGDIGDAGVLFLLAAACLAFLRYNFHPASIFLGDSGSMFLGLTLAVTSLESIAKGPAVASLGIPLLAAGVPMFDAFLAVWRRGTRRALERAESRPGTNGTGVFMPDTDHLHHRLLRSGLSDRAVAGWLYVFAAALVCTGLLAMVFRSHAVGIMLCAFVAGVYVIVRHLANVELWTSGALILNGMHRPPRQVVFALLYPPMDMLLLTAAMLVSFLLVPEGAPEATFAKRIVREMPFWVGLPFIGLCVSKVYSRLWSRARIAEHAMVAAVLAAAILLAAGTLCVIKGSSGRFFFLNVVVYAGIAIPAVVGVRMFRRLVEDVMAWSRGRSHNSPAASRRTVLLVGSGPDCALFLRSKGVESADGERDRQIEIAGLIDEDTNLHGRYVHGYRVLGNIDRLDTLAEQHHADEFIVAASLPSHHTDKLIAVARQRNIRVTRWRPALEAVYSPGDRSLGEKR